MKPPVRCKYESGREWIRIDYILKLCNGKFLVSVYTYDIPLLNSIWKKLQKCISAKSQESHIIKHVEERMG